jgi:hypothetical protein
MKVYFTRVPHAWNRDWPSDSDTEYWTLLILRPSSCLPRQLPLLSDFRATMAQFLADALDTAIREIEETYHQIQLSVDALQSHDPFEQRVASHIMENAKELNSLIKLLNSIERTLEGTVEEVGWWFRKNMPDTLTKDTAKGAQSEWIRVETSKIRLEKLLADFRKSREICQEHRSSVGVRTCQILKPTLTIARL